MISKLSFVLLLFLFSGNSNANESSPLLGIYYDSFAGISAKGGYALVFTDSHERLSGEITDYKNSYFVYSDVEIGARAQKISAGFGLTRFVGILRGGISYARHDGEDKTGVELVAGAMMLSLKIGYYESENSESNFAVGIGIGF